MEKLYDRINWHNNTDPAINETNLNRMDQAIDEIDDRVIELSGTLVETVPEIKEYLDESEDLVERIETMSKNPPYIGANGNWYVFNTNTMQYEDSGIDASITVQIADITMIPYIDAPYVTNSGTNTDPIFHLYIPRAATIASVEKTAVVGRVDTYTMTLQDGSTFNFTVTNGEGFGDMQSIVYDPQGTVSTEGGIIAYGDMRLAQGLIEGVGHTHGAQSPGKFMHIEGTGSTVDNGAKNVHVEGVGHSMAVCSAAHAEGMNNTILTEASHIEGMNGYAGALASHVEGIGSSASGDAAHAEGYNTRALQVASHSEGRATYTNAEYSHAEGNGSSATAAASHAEGKDTRALGQYSHAEGSNTIADFIGAHAEGNATTASGQYSHAEGGMTKASGLYSHAEGNGTSALNAYAHAEGQDTKATGSAAHAEGVQSRATGSESHAEGLFTVASGAYSHAEGNDSVAEGQCSHAEGYACITSSVANAAHAGGISSSAFGECSFAQGHHCAAFNNVSTAIGIDGQAYDEEDLLTHPRMFVIGTPKAGHEGFINELEVEHSEDPNSDIVRGMNIFSVDMYGNTFMRGFPFTAKGVIYNRLIANGDYYVLEDGAAYVLWTNTRMINNNAWRGAQAYFIVAPFAPHAYGEGASTTALAVAQHHQFSTIGTAGLTLKKDTVQYQTATGATAYHARIGIGSCVANCCVRYTLIKVVGSELDMTSDYA